MKKIVITVCLASSILFGGGCKAWEKGFKDSTACKVATGVAFFAVYMLAFEALAPEAFYDCAESPPPTKLMFLKNGDAQFWYGEEKADKGGSWVIKDGRIKIKFPDSGEVIYEIQPNGDLRCVEEMRGGEVTAIPMEMQYTLKRTNSLLAPQNN